MASNETIACVGELLWDVLPDGGRTLGGAPANVAYHLTQLGRAPTLVTRVGRDEPGDAALAELAAHGVSAVDVQRDAALPTGAAHVTLDAHGRVAYRFLTPAAFDALEAPTHACDVVIFGTLAQRAARAAATIRALASAARVAVYDVNLRPPHTAIDTVLASLPLATIVKLSEEEAGELAGALGAPAGHAEFARYVSERFGARLVCVTRGAGGAGLWTGRRWHDAAGIAASSIDPVGAGDAFLAALVAGWLDGGEPVALLEQANRLGAYVATQRGAMPRHEHTSLT